MKQRMLLAIIAAIAGVIILSCAACLGIGLLGGGSRTPTPTVAIAQAPTSTSAPLATATIEPADTAEPTAAPILAETAAPSSTDEPSTPTATVVPTATITTATKLQVHYIAVGQGDAILILAPDGAAALIDGGDTGSGVVSYLQSQGVQRLDLVVATHPHADHIGGLPEVLKAFPVDQVVTNGEMHTTATYERFLDAIADSGAEYTEVRRGGTLQFGGLTLQVLHPASLGDNMNSNSVVLRLDHGQVSFLFMGDAEADAEAAIRASGQPLSATVLKVGHHGSRSSSSAAFLLAVQPEAAVYCAGMGNSYDHPHGETLAALANVGAQVYGTDANGTVIVTSDGTGYTVDVAKQGLPRSPPTARPTRAPTLAAPTATPPDPPPPSDNCAYIGNSNTRKFHKLGCSSINQMNPEHRVCLVSREAAVVQGFEPCGRCKP